MLLLGLVLGLSGCHDDERASTGVPLVGWAIGAKPLEGATVEIHTPDGALLGTAEEPTGPTGLFTARVAMLPTDFTVTAEGGGERLVAEVRGYKAFSPVHVNHATTLVALRLAGRDGSLAESEAAVRRLLELPAHSDLGTDLRVSDRRFSGAEFASAAAAAGGTDALAQQLLAEAESGGTHPFPGPPPNDGAVAEEALLDQFLGKVKSAATEKAGGLAVGWLAQQVGLGGDPDAAALAAIQTDLAAMQQQMTTVLDDLNEIISDLNDLAYSNAVTSIKAVASDTKIAFADYDALAQASTTTARATALDTFLNYVYSQNNSGVSNHLQEFSDGLQGDIYDVLLGNDESTAALDAWGKSVAEHRRYWDDESQTQFRKAFHFWAGIQSQLFTMLTEYKHARPDAPGFDLATLAADWGSIESGKLHDEYARAGLDTLLAIDDGLVLDSATNALWSKTPIPWSANWSDVSSVAGAHPTVPGWRYADAGDIAILVSPSHGYPAWGSKESSIGAFLTNEVGMSLSGIWPIVSSTQDTHRGVTSNLLSVMTMEGGSVSVRCFYPPAAGFGIPLCPNTIGGVKIGIYPIAPQTFSCSASYVPVKWAPGRSC